MAKKFGKTTVSEDSVEPETETSDALNGSDGGQPPKVATGTRPGSSGGGGGGGGQRPSKAANKPGLFARIGQFLRDTRAEMRRVSWPTAIMVRNTTIITLIAVVFFALYLFAVDRVWAFLIGYLRTWLGG